jgi:predicted CXXCH cytochrome family protein
MRLKLPHWNPSKIIFGGAAAWGLFLVGCVMADRTMVAPPQVAGATFVGSKKCADCHEDFTSQFHDATHAKLTAAGGHGQEIGCESCHGPASLHVKAGGGAGTIVNPGASPETCFQCHLDKRGEFSLAHTHPVLSGKMTCSDCHNPHTGEAVVENTTNMAALNSTCLKCHTSQGGPYVFEHEASREGCTVCHLPHGSMNARMLKARNANLCLQCHFQEQTAPGVILIGGRDHASFLTRGTCWSGGCHEAVHGSHVSSSLRF